MARMRDLTGEPAAMRALSHPVRLAVLDLLGEVGTLTATEAGARLGESPGTMSWHLGVLARYGLVTEAAGGRGRRRPWRLAATGTKVGAEPGGEDERRAADGLLRAVVDRAAGQLRAWLATRWEDDEAWRRAAALSDWTLYLTADEARELRDAVYGLFEAYTDRLTDPASRPPGARPVKTLFTSHPLPRP